MTYFRLRSRLTCRGVSLAAGSSVMATFTGTLENEEITLTSVSPTVVAQGAPRPGSGPDTIFGGGGDDTIVSGGGADIISGGQGSDIAFMGAGKDTFNWVPGDGSDVV